MEMMTMNLAAKHEIHINSGPCWGPRVGVGVCVCVKKNGGPIRLSSQRTAPRKGMRESQKKTLLGTTHRGINLGSHNWIQMQIQHQSPSGKATLNLAKIQCVYATPNREQQLILCTVHVGVAACILEGMNLYISGLNITSQQCLWQDIIVGL